MALPETASFREFADVARVKPSYVTELRKAGRLVLTDDGKRVRVAESLNLIEATRDPAKAAVAARHAADRAAARSDATAAVDDDDGGVVEPASSPYHEHRAERERWQALSAKRDYELSIGKLMDAGEVESAVKHAGTMLRKALERLPEVLAPQLAPIADEEKIRLVLHDEIQHALAELSRDLAAVGKQAAT